MQRLEVWLDEDVVLWLERICQHSHSGFLSPGELIEYLARSAADGARRPGSWERGWLEQATGVDGFALGKYLAPFTRE